MSNGPSEKRRLMVNPRLSESDQRRALIAIAAERERLLRGPTIRRQVGSRITEVPQL